MSLFRVLRPRPLLVQDTAADGASFLINTRLGKVAVTVRRSSQAAA
ncbi:hypothetical protein [Chenggangzhangella methanolivorans]|uniref:Uncharacterized protein n=1 Tax=Chenggangzhangella methanolivorans TaxID=1437009 RepID=A0A9E6R5U6_9HYPH|nr:hypothetical protein [Chenggangzhangella methanolivorans]QZN98747.1 hypothetical protein K6K41_17455 [Chenggangzhangella methanolivorans]